MSKSFLLKISLRKSAFTLVELLVSIGIITLISALVFGNGRELSDTVAVTSAGQEISLAGRQAQLYGTSVRDAGSGQFNNSYGIVFNTSSPGNTIIFADTNGNKIYDGSTSCSGECVERDLLQNNVVISKICALDSGGNQVCGGDWRSADVLFTRPSLDALITIIDGSGSTVAGPWSGLVVTISSPLGVTKKISFNTTGQISIQ